LTFISKQDRLKSMNRKVLFGVIWLAVFNLGGVIIVSGVAGGIAGASHPENPAAAGALAGQDAADRYRLIITLSSFVLAFLGAWAGILPGTRKKKTDEPPPMKPGV
jgi:hypothetical protein